MNSNKGIHISEKFESAVLTVLKRAGVNSVIAGVSGGADSVAMLLALASSGIDILAVHCNFQLRGDESNRDQRFVTELCQRLNIPLISRVFDTEKYRSERRLSVETACRELRYEEFRKLKNERKFDRIAVAHNANDNAETLLLNLMRGAGISGLRAMLADTGEIIRPLLAISRREILGYLEAKNETFVTDSTNMSCDYRRNFIRNRIIPLLEREWPRATHSICRSIANLQREERVLDRLETDLIKPGCVRLDYKLLQSSKNPEWLVYRFISRFGGNFEQSEEICSMLADSFQSGKKWMVDGGIIVAERDCLEFVPDFGFDFKIIYDEFDVDKTLITSISSAPLSELWTILEPDKVGFRNVAPGDRIRPLGMSGSITVSKIMKDAKLSESEKRQTVVAYSVADGEIIWVSGLKRGRSHLVEANHKKAFRYTVRTNLRHETF